MFYERLGLLPETLGAYRPCPPGSDREAWAAVPQRLKEKYAARALRCAGKPWPEVLASGWAAFFQSGSRTQFETPYLERRRRLNDLILAECAQWEGRFLPDILDGVCLLCEETAWQSPAHNSYIRDAAQLPWPDTGRPVLDLFSCETGALLACAYFLLGSRLPGPVRGRIRAELERRVVRPYLTEHFWWMGNGAEPMCNWTTWCTQNVLLAVFCTPQPESLRRQVVEKAAYSIDCFLKDYGEDGCCCEGAQYYGAAGLCLYGALEILSAAAPAAFLPLWQEQKLCNIAAYIDYMHVDGKYYINFADCSPVAGRRGAREFLFAQKIHDPGLASFAAADWREAIQLPDDNREMSRVNLYYLLLEAFAARAMERCPALPRRRREIYYPSAGVFVARDAAYCLAVKAGGNGDSHNHNDTGSFLVYKDGRPLLIDLGAEVYTRKTFSKDRYDIWTMQSSWHNLPAFDGVMQKAGAAYRARDVRTSFTAAESRISMELSAAWPPAAGLHSYRRTVRLQKGKRILVQDVCGGTFSEAAMHLITPEEPRIDGCQIRLGGDCLVRACGSGEIGFETVAVTDPHLRAAWPGRIFRIRIPFRDTLSLEIT